MSSLLFNLRCSSVNQFKEIFHILYGKSLPCKLQCGKGINSQCHSLSCEDTIIKLTPAELVLINQVHYSHMFGSIEEYMHITSIFSRILENPAYGRH